MFATGKIDASQLETITEQLNARSAEITEALAKASQHDPLELLADGDVRKLWDGLTLSTQRAILNRVCEIRVLPTTPTRFGGFDEDAIDIVWKVG